MDVNTQFSSKQRKNRPKKRKFRGNQYTGSLKPACLDVSGNESSVSVSPSSIVIPRPSVADGSTRMDVGPNTISASASKLEQSVNLASTSVDNSGLSGFRLFDIQSLISFVNLIPCRSCGSIRPSGSRSCVNSVSPDYAVSERITGLSSVFNFQCKYCLDDFSFDTSPDENVNLRYQLAIFSIGINRDKSQRFLANMNMPPPVSKAQAAKYKSRILKATESTAKESMLSAAKEVKEDLGTDCITASCDGTWQKRGFSSKNGIATVLSVNPKKASKVVDIEVMSNHCDACSKAKKRLTGDKLQEWMHAHTNCQRNHNGPAGQMEPLGMLQIFYRSEERNGLKYINYLGDGDSKSFKTVSEASPPVYRNVQIQKMECCGHIQKRMGKRLMDKVAECKGKVYEENGKKFQGIGNAGRLTISAIKRIQGHYGAAIRNNCNDIVNMKKSIMAILKHRDGKHEDCGTWCPKDVQLRDKNKLPRFVINEIKSVFEELSSDSLLMKCLHGGTQNGNESFHNLIWNRCPKTVFAGRDRVTIAAMDAAIVYNDGELGRAPIFEKLGISFGQNCKTGFLCLDKRRITGSKIKGKIKETLETQKKKSQLKENTMADDSYISGGF